MKQSVVALLAIAVLYATIWPHELGHSIGAFLSGCKANWWQTDTSWFLWGSWGGDIDYDCLRARGGPALGLTEFAGIAVNFLLLALALTVARSRRLAPPSREWVLVGSVLWALANYAEAFSYLVLNTIVLRSDMKTVVYESGVSRWVWCGAGVLGAIVCARALRRLPGRQRRRSRRLASRVARGLGYSLSTPSRAGRRWAPLALFSLDGGRP
jgi:hypothetical protein